jgi:hypothetical protein
LFYLHKSDYEGNIFVIVPSVVQIGIGGPGEYFPYLQQNRDEEEGGGRCVVRMSQPNITTNCSICSNSR